METEATRPKNQTLNDNLRAAILANDMLHPIKKLTQYEYQGLSDTKKERIDNDLNLRNLLFPLSLCLSLLFVITAINWRFYDNGGLVDLGVIDDSFEALTEVPISNQPPPPPPQAKIENMVIVEVENEQVLEELELNIDMEITQADVIADVIYDDIPIQVEEERVDEIFQIVENQPEPEGGLSSFYQYIAENLDYPAVARRLGVSGVVYVRFVVEKEGNLTDAVVIKGIGAGCDAEAIRAINEAPNWIPGKQRGRAVRVFMTVPIRFVLHER
ncbi:MAG: protein TonB [Cyclobacteriaceae bacterium]|jgi:protein TonB